MINASDVLQHIDPVDPESVYRIPTMPGVWELTFRGGMTNLDRLVLKRTPGVDMLSVVKVKSGPLEFDEVRIRVDPREIDS